MKGNRMVLTISIFDIAVFTGGILLTNLTKYGSSSIAWSLATIAIGTFFGLLYIGDMKTAIAGSFVTLYFALLIIYSFSKFQPTVTSDLAKQVIGQFTVLIGTVIAGYFGATAVVEREREKAKQQDRGETPGASPG